MTNTAKKVISNVEYPIDIRYGEKDWDMVAALREPLANMLDTRAEYKFYWENGIGNIEDFGEGLPLSAFVLGASTKSQDSGAIGQFGEGLKLTFITCLREGRSLEISTVGYGATIESFYSDTNNATLMRVVYNDNSRDKGTHIKIECTKEEWDNATDLFLQFKDGYQQIDKNLFLPSGFVCILGLTTEKRDNLIFSYNLNDKTVTNRDRNVIKSKGLKGNMIKILNSLKTQKAVKMYFEGLETNPEAEEFKFALEPKDKDLWINSLKRLYGKSICYSTTVQNDLKAQTKGYYVMRNITKKVISTLKYLGIESSKEVTSDIKGDVGFVEKREKKIKFTISEEYCSDWTFLDAGREFLANALDTTTDIKHYLSDDGYYYIEDKGVGLKKEHFVIGNSQKTSSDIGKFGEGLKIAALVLTRLGRDVRIDTVGTSYIPVIERNDEFSINLFAINYESNRKKSGTVVRFKASREEVVQIENLFLAFKKDFQIVKGQCVDIILEKEGAVYVNGLQSAKVNTLFSYNVKDKNIVNTRDRNGVNEVKLDEYLEKTLNVIEDEVIIEKLLLGWKENSSYYEYKLILNPQNLDLYKNICSRLFDKSCIQTHNMMANATAKNAGYTLLTNIPPYIKEMFLVSGLPTSDDVAKEYSGGVSLENRLVTVISAEYASNWTVSDAFRELISNAYDTHTEVSVDLIGNVVKIEDAFTGIRKSDLIFGSGSKTVHDENIGLFGEGLKMAMLVLARENRNLVIETVGFVFTPKIEFDEDFGVHLLVIYFDENTREVGTSITFKSNKKELNDVKSRFLKLTDKYSKVCENMYTPGGAIFINGVCIESSLNSEFSYNIVDRRAKSVLERDRKSINSHIRNTLVGEILKNVQNYDVIESFLNRAKSYSFESEVARYISLYGRQKTVWRKVAIDVFYNSCIPSIRTEVNLVAQDKGIHVLDRISDSLKDLLSLMNFPTAETAINIRRDFDVARDVVSEKDLTEKELEKWLKLKTVFLKELGEEYSDKFLICKEFANPENGETHGLYAPAYDTCYILRKLLSNDKYTIAYCLGVLIHEALHRETGSHDRTREFENHLTDKIGSLCARLYNL